MDDPKFSKKNLVTVERNIKGSIIHDPQIWGPMSLDDAIKAGHLTTSSGTVDVRITSHGEHDGCHVYCDSTGNYRVRERVTFDPYTKFKAFIP